MKRIYVCHTYYHVYVTLLKELNFLNSNKIDEKADIVLSNISTDFKNLKENLNKSNIFNRVFELNEKHRSELIGTKIEKLNEYKMFGKLIKNIYYTYRIPIELNKYIDIDFTIYNNIFLFWDADPISYYFNNKRIEYTVVEDGLDTYKAMEYKNDRRFLFFEKILSNFGLLFIPHGYSKYAKNIEVNDRNGVWLPNKKVYEISRKALLDNLDYENKMHIFKIFADGLIKNDIKNQSNKRSVLLITQPFFPIYLNYYNQIKMYKEIISTFCNGFDVYIKPHPRDNIDYNLYFNDCKVLEKYLPLEIFNFDKRFCFDLAITVSSTSLVAINFVEEKKYLGENFIEKFKE